MGSSNGGAKRRSEDWGSSSIEIPTENFVDRNLSDFVGVAPKRHPSFADMSSPQRSASMDATVERVAQLSVAHNLMAGVIRAQGERIDALERVTAQRWALPFMARLRWLLTGR